MSVSDKRFAVTIGLCIVDSEVKSLSDFGIRYGRLHYADMVAVEAVVAKHNATLVASMEPIIKDIMAIGIAQAAVEEPERAAKVAAMVKGVKSTDAPIRERGMR